MNKNTQKIYVGLIALAIGLILNNLKDSSFIPDNRLIQQFIPLLKSLRIKSRLCI